MKPHFVRFASVLAFAVLLNGCAAYQYRIVEPPEVAGPIDRTESIDFPWQVLEYRIVDGRGQLGLLIINSTDEPVLLLGERSYIVDPNGETHPMRSRTIAPHSRITIALPPQPVYSHARPRVSVGVGVGTGYRGGRVGTGVYGHRWAGYPHWSDYPHHVYVQEGGPFWRWTEGTVRMRLAYEHEGSRIDHDFTFDRFRVR